MKLLIVTQAVDTDDPVLGFFHRWIEELAKRAESVEVICLREGKHQLPPNVRVHSLGKEKGGGNPLLYAFRFLSLAWKLRRNYDAVFVHMNQEYILIAGWLWKLLGKRIYMWRNHYAGSIGTDIAAMFCKKVFCTSRHSYTAKFRKTEIMPVGVDTERFGSGASVLKKPRYILFLSRMAPSKRPEMLLGALAILKKKGIAFSATLAGSPLPSDAAYYASLKERVEKAGLQDQVSFSPGVANEKTPALYGAHEIFVNCSPSGMLDKTIFEAAASGCIPLASSDDFAEMAGTAYHFENAEQLAERLTAFLSEPSPRSSLQALAEQNSLTALSERLFSALLPDPSTL